MVCATLFYYCVLGPFYSISVDETVVVYKDARPYYYLGWLATLIGILGYFCGYHFGVYGSIFSLGRRFRGNKQTLVAIRGVFLAFGFLGLLFMVKSKGMSLGSILMPGNSPARVGASVELGSFGNYVTSMTNFIFGFVLILVALNRGLKMRILIPAGGLFLLFVLLWAAAGFRGNIVMAIVGLGVLVCLLKRRHPAIPTLTVISLSLVFLSGIILYSRNYFRGLDFERLNERTAGEILEGGLNESMTFGAMSLCIEAVPERFPYHGLENLWLTITMPIPRQLWPGKPTSTYLGDIQRILGEGEARETVGQAIPNLGEYYMALGWPGVFCGMFLFGLICRKFWRWYVFNRNDVLATAAYAVFFAWIFTFMHRGFLPQTFTSFCFLVLPLLVIRHFVGTIPLQRILPAKEKEDEAQGSTEAAHSQ